MIFVCLFFEVSTDQGYQFFLPWRLTMHIKAHTKSNFSRTPAMLKEPLKLNSL